jgi:hypothetical protein
MKLEFLANGSCDCPLIRLYDFTADDITRLLVQFKALASGEHQNAVLHEMRGVVPVAGCRLILRSGPTDEGLALVAPPAAFECALSADGWGDVVGLAEPFVSRSAGFQWLTTTGNTKWLLTKDGAW